MVERKRKACAAIAGVHAAVEYVYMGHHDAYGLWIGEGLRSAVELDREGANTLT
jgi:hypothetical protein